MVLKSVHENKYQICFILLASIIFLSYMLYSQNLTLYDLYFVRFTLLVQLITFTSCFIHQNASFIVICHYLYCIIVLFGLFLTNKKLLIYFLIVIIYNLYILIIYKKCIFDSLQWNHTWIDSIDPKYYFFTLFLLYFGKLAFIFANSAS